MEIFTQKNQKIKIDFRTNSDQSKRAIFRIGLGLVGDAEVYMFALNKPSIEGRPPSKVIFQ